MSNPLNTKLNPICHLLALLGAHPIFHVSRKRVKILRTYSCSEKYIKCNIWRVAVRQSYI